MKNYQLFAKFLLGIFVLCAACQQGDSEQQESNQVEAAVAMSTDTTQTIFQTDTIQNTDAHIEVKKSYLEQKPNDTNINKGKNGKHLHQGGNIQIVEYDTPPQTYDDKKFTLIQMKNGKWRLVQKRTEPIPDHRIKPIDKTQPAIGKK